MSNFFDGMESVEVSNLTYDKTYDMVLEDFKDSLISFYELVDEALEFYDQIKESVKNN